MRIHKYVRAYLYIRLYKAYGRTLFLAVAVLPVLKRKSIKYRLLLDACFRDVTGQSRWSWHYYTIDEYFGRRKNNCYDTPIFTEEILKTATDYAF